MLNKTIAGSMLAATLAVTLVQAASWAAPGETNSVNNGRDVAGGTYYNTAGNETLFQNTGAGGLWLHSGTTVRGLEVNGSNATTGNGGAIRLSAPGNVVRLDGTIDVSAMRQGTLYTGNGGKVTIDSGYLYQNGNVIANGVNGGQVVMNVGAATFGPNAKIQAMGSAGGNGGTVTINGANGVVDIHKGAIIDTSGKVVGTYDTNVINITSGVVNNSGVLKANGLSDGQAGGQIRLVSTGSADFTPASDAIALANTANTPIFNANQTNSLNTRGTDLATNRNGDIYNQGGTLQANGAQAKGKDSLAGAGGRIVLNAAGNDVVNTGDIEANGGQAKGRNSIGGNGGLVQITSDQNILNNREGSISANGGESAYAGGNGGRVSMNAPVSISNRGTLESEGGDGKTLGGNGGTMTFSTNDFSSAGDFSVDGGEGHTSDGENGRFSVTAPTP